MDKKCNSCGKTKPLSEFFARILSTDGLTASCKECVRNSNKKAYLKKTETARIAREKELLHRMYVEKLCSKCKIIKPVSEFHKNKGKSDGLSDLCKFCKKEQAASRKYDPAARRASYLRNKDKADKYSLEYQSLKRKNDPGFRINKLIRSAFANKLKGKKVRKNKKLLNYTDVPIKEYIRRLEGDPLWEDYKNGVPMHIDHIIPCAVYNFDLPEDIKRCWNPRNLRFMFAQENMQKSARLDMAIILEYGIEDLLPVDYIY